MFMCLFLLPRHSPFCFLVYSSLFGWLVPFQLSKEAENAVNKSRGLLDDIVRENKGNVLSNAYYN